MDDQVDQFDPDERRDDAAEAIDPQVPSQQCARADRAVADAFERDRDQRRDDDAR